MSSFPSISSQEPPPLDSTSEEEDSEEFRTPAGLKLDLLTSGEPSPLSTPRKSPKKNRTESSLAERFEENGHIIGEDDHDLVSTKNSISNGHVYSNEGSANENASVDDDDDFEDCLNEDVVSITASKIDPSSAPHTDGVITKSEQLQSAVGVGDNFEEEEEERNSSGSSSDIPSAVEEHIADKAASDNSKCSEKDSSRDGDVFQDFAVSGAGISLEEHIEPKTLSQQEEEDGGGFDDFAAFQACDNMESASTVEEDSGMSPSMKTSYIGSHSLQETTTMTADVEEEEGDDDDFGDFSSNSFQSSEAATMVADSSSPTKPSNNHHPPDSGVIRMSSVDSEDFANFTDMPFTTSAAYHTNLMSPRSSADFTAALESKFDALIRTVIPKPSPDEEEEEVVEQDDVDRTKPPQPSKMEQPFILIEKELSDTKDYCWGHTIDFEDSRSLLHKWVNSSCQQKLYGSLKIDTSTIVYTEKWGAIEVPRFAASMVETPLLQPQVVKMTESPERRNSSSSREDNPVVVPNGKPLSIEAQQIIQKIPDISYMTSKTLVFPQVAASSSSSSSNSFL
ncbi:uncharacterized protein LOC110859218 isoform X2 [Folsomia candida]|uniref:Aftiphilin n=1 Tax=Folsomia candida TaxID=158441 RepID=A0A226DCK3_FOLCA|nr:uncharacterized protein LOC110859218 isoform X2 [Folsomia candida]OXA42658.1 Aftiphilin [Folsomia candida]